MQKVGMAAWVFTVGRCVGKNSFNEGVGVAESMGGRRILLSTSSMQEEREYLYLW